MSGIQHASETQKLLQRKKGADYENHGEHISYIIHEAMSNYDSFIAHQLTLLVFSKYLTISFFGGFGTNPKHDVSESSGVPIPKYSGMGC